MESMRDEGSLIFEMKDRAERVLCARFGDGVRLDGGENLGGSDRSYTYRYVVVDGPDQVPASAVVKKARSWDEGKVYDPDVAEDPAAGLFNDWAGLDFLTEISEGRTLRDAGYGFAPEVGSYSSGR